MKQLLFVLIVLLSGCKYDEAALLGPDPTLVTFTLKVPANTPRADEIRIVGNFRDDPWNPEKSRLILKRQTDGTYKAVFGAGEIPTPQFQFKFVRGITFAYVEKGRTASGACQEVPNRIINSSAAGGKKFDFEVIQWADLTPNCN